MDIRTLLVFVDNFVEESNRKLGALFKALLKSRLCDIEIRQFLS